MCVSVCICLRVYVFVCNALFHRDMITLIQQVLGAMTS